MKFKTTEKPETQEVTEVKEEKKEKDNFFVDLYGRLFTLSFLYGDDEDLQDAIKHATKTVKKILDTWYAGWEMPAISIPPDINRTDYVKETFTLVEENCPFDLKKLMAAYTMATLMPKLLKNGN